MESDPIAVLLQSVWTDRSRARQVGKQAVPIAGIANLVRYNYMIYYNQYEEMEFGQFLRQGNLTDLAWERSALKHVAAAHTPMMPTHGKTTTIDPSPKPSSVSSL